MSAKNRDFKETIKVMPVEVYSRVVGYFRPVEQWNVGKTAEYSDRKVIDPKQIQI